MMNGGRKSWPRFCSISLMKRKTFAKLQTIALCLLLVEAMMLLALFLAQTEASAEVNGNKSASHKNGYLSASVPGAGNTQPPGGGAHGGKTGFDLCAQENPICLLWGDAADILNPEGGGAGSGGIFSFGDTNGQGGGGLAGLFNLPPGPSGHFGVPLFFGNFGAGHPTGGFGDFGGDNPGDDPINQPGVTNFEAASFAGTDLDDDGQDDSGNSPALLRTLAEISVPEPWTAPLFISGLAAVLALRRRKRAA